MPDPTATNIVRRVDTNDIHQLNRLNTVVAQLRHDKITGDTTTSYEQRANAADLGHHTLMYLAEAARREGDDKWGRYSGSQDERRLKAGISLADWLMDNGWTPPATLPIREEAQEEMPF